MELGDSELLARYRDGDSASMEVLVWRYKRQLFAFILNMTGNGVEADDVFQDVWLKAIKKLDSYREGSFLGWLTRIAHNTVVDRWRARKPAVSLDEDEGEGKEVARALADVSQGPDRQAEAADLKKKVERALSMLPLEQREVVVMRIKTGLSFKEIAKAQGVSINTALARMQYGLSKLKRTLASERSPVAGENET